jgi:putative ABC transport system ATP-binding protein
VLEVYDVNKAFVSVATSTQVLQGVSFTLDNGKSLSIQGPSGCGKSTLLHLLGALDKPDSGTISFSPTAQQKIKVSALSESGADLCRRKHIGFVFQKFNLIDCLSVRDNIWLPSRLNGFDDDDYVESLVVTLGIQSHLHKLPNQLSGGEQQRVAIARALAHQPDLVLADEPTGNLDEENSDIVSELLFTTCRQLQTTLVIVTHSANVAKRADIQLRMHNKRLVA